MPHIHEAIDFTVEVYIVYKDKVLLRLHDKYGIWLAVGGHIELNEDPNQAALREVREEVGLDVELYDSRIRQERNSKYAELIPPMFMNRHRISETHEHVTLVYFAKTYSDKITQSAPEEISQDCRWFTKAELETFPELRPSVRDYALRALETLL